MDIGPRANNMEPGIPIRHIGEYAIMVQGTHDA